MTLIRRLSRIDSIENHCFLPRFLSRDSLVIDLGVNDGGFSRIVAKRYGVRCLGVEANPKLFTELKPSDRVSYFNFAVSGTNDPVTFRVSEDSTASSAINPDVPTPKEEVTVTGKTLASFIAEQGIDRIDLLKVDIEGAEVPMFASTDDALLKRIPQMSIEFHDDFGYISREDVLAIRRRLADLGFESIKFSPNNINWLFFRRDMAGPLERTYIRHVVRNARGVLRRAGLREPGA